MVECHLNAETQTLTCFFSGRMDTIKTGEDEKTVKKYMTEIAEQKTVLGAIVFDLSGVEYIASSFIRLCLTTARIVSKGRFSIVNTNPVIKKTFMMTGFDNAFNVS